MGKKKPDPSETARDQIAAQQRAKQDEATGRAQRTTEQFEGPIEETRAYKTNLARSLEATSRGYDIARGNIRARARGAGFGYNQPIEGAAEDQLGAQEASRFGDIPRETYMGLIPASMQAAGLESGIGGQYGRGGVDYSSQATELAKQRLQPRGGLWKSLAKLGMLGTSMIPGVGPGVSAGLQAGAGMDF